MGERRKAGRVCVMGRVRDGESEGCVRVSDVGE